MTMLLAELYIAVVAIAGLSIGFWLQSRLDSSHQSEVKLPSAFERPHAWVSQEGHALA